MTYQEGNFASCVHCARSIILRALEGDRFPQWYPDSILDPYLDTACRVISGERCTPYLGRT